MLRILFPKFKWTVDGESHETRNPLIAVPGTLFMFLWVSWPCVLIGLIIWKVVL